MSNSSLVDYTLLSPNNSGKRTHKVDRITPHCFVGQVTAERGAEVFLPESRQASCQYVIGLDGRVALVCDEGNRSWCTSSNSNDQRAITIECASDNTHPYAFTNACYNKLIELTIDICKRYGKTKLVWINNKEQALAYEPKDNELQVTVHRWFANKSCPGDWMMDKMDDYVTKVNSKIAKTSVNMSEKEIWDYLLSTGMTACGVAGLMGNLYAECGLKACNLQNNGNNRLGLTDEQFTAKVDSDEYSKETFIRDGYGYGLAQWTYWSRKQALYEYVVSKGASIGCCKTQLEYLVKEISGYKAVISVLKSTTSVREASDIVLLQYERPADQSEAVQVKRANFGQVYYDRYANVTPAPIEPKPVEKKYYRVRLSWTDAKSQLGAYEVLDNAKKACKVGYTVYDWNGKEVYSNKVETTKVLVEGDVITLKAGSTYWDGKAIPSWVFKSTLYYRGKNNNGVIFSTLKTGAVTGVVKESAINELNNNSNINSGANNKFPYKVKVIVDALNYRKGPGTNYGINGAITDKGIYTIVDENNGWGKLKSGAGWIKLSYTKKL